MYRMQSTIPLVLVLAILTSVAGCGLMDITSNLGDHPASQEECEAANGVWQRWGLSPTESCNLRTGDYGRACTDDSECQGRCTTDCFDADCATEPGSCTEFIWVYGCFGYWEDGELQAICVD